MIYSKAVFSLLIMVFLILSSTSLLAEPSYLEKVAYTKEPEWVDSSLVSITDMQETLGKPSRSEKKATQISELSSVGYQLVDSQLNMVGSKHEDYFRVIQQINNEQGLSTAAELYFNFVPDYQEVEIHNIHIIRDGKIIDKTKTELEVIRQEEGLKNKIITGRVTALAILEDVQIGDVIDYAYTVKGSNPIFNNKKFAMFNTSWMVDIDQVRVRVLSSRDRPLHHKVLGSSAAVNEQISNDIITYTWQDTSIEAESTEQGYPAWYQHFDSVEFSEFNTWQEVTDWALDIYKKEQDLSDELTALNKQWMQEAKDIKEYLVKVVDFVQSDIRYFGIELSENSHKPRHPNEVFTRRYGDCKDKALMITSLLAQHNIQSWSALVSASTHEGVENRLPSPGAFDHVINKIIHDGQVYWIDGTNSAQEGDLRERSINLYGRALLVKDDITGLDNLDEAPVNTSKDHLIETYTSTGYDKPVFLSFSYNLKGAQADYQRLLHAQNGLSYVQDNVLDYFARQFPTSKVKSPVEFIDNVQTNEVLIAGVIEITDYWEVQDSVMTIPLIGENLSSYLVLPEQINRSTPLANYEAIEVVHEVNMQLHESIEWDIGQADITIQNDGFNYSRKVSAKGDHIKAIHQYQPVSNTIDVDNIETFVTELKQAREELYYAIVISHGNTEQTELRNKLRSMLKL